ncbi:MAG: tRNA (N6-isopentenyl adenosine(37)-C2)-methylthiotransferase MiaB [Candidatus Zixiibacteriota bacterium]|nr:MAG: tRNA (N6-isopentenyl adenosine(37)-C2)-methylthiotransferase MiaB [candidate division Zixibacteria bacterium]
MPTERPIETFHISTFGCQMNLADSSTLVATLKTRGYRRVEHEKDADLIIFNTCSVREKAEERVIGRLGQVSRYKRRKPHVRIAVVGCMAQRLGEELKERVPYVDYVLGTDRLFELPDVIEGQEGSSQVMTAFGHENIDLIEPVQESPYSGFVTISRGCDNYCTYCIVPYVRGKERSHSAEHIINGVRKMVADGVVEITLLGQNVNSYRYENIDFPDLLKRVATETEVRRLRFMTSHPKDLSRKLVDTLAAEPKLMPHIHLPLQSGSDRILRKMGRIYTLEHYMKIVRYIRRTLPYVSLTTDLIVGFPSETEAEFEETLAAVREIQYDSAFMFRYSVRPGTTAARYDDDVPEEVKIRRLNTLIALQQQIAYERNQREVGMVHDSLVEGYSRRSRDMLRARTGGNKTVIFPAADIPAGTVVPVRITAADAFTLHGEVVTGTS